jgi:chemotaxis protein CheC
MSIAGDQLDGLKELLTIGAGRAASLLNELTGLHISLDVPHAHVCAPDSGGTIFGAGNQGQLAVVTMPFHGSFSGSSNLIIGQEEATKLVSLISEDDGSSHELDETTRGTLTEVGNIVLNGVMGSVGNVLSHHLDYGVPTLVVGTLPELKQSMIRDAAAVVMAKVRFSVKGHEIAGEIVLLFDVGSFYGFMSSLDGLSQSS